MRYTYCGASHKIVVDGPPGAPGPVEGCEPCSATLSRLFPSIRASIAGTTWSKATCRSMYEVTGERISDTLQLRQWCAKTGKEPCGPINPSAPMGRVGWSYRGKR